MTGKELLHGCLFEVALLGDELIQRGDQGIHIAQGGGDGALFGERWDRVLKIDGVPDIELLLSSTILYMLNLFPSVSRVHHTTQPIRIERRMLSDNHHGCTITSI